MPSLGVLTAVALVAGVALVLFTQLTGARPASAVEDLVPPAIPYGTALAVDRTLGAADAPVVLEVWSDFQCPVCGRYARIVEPELVTRYVETGQVRIVHRDAAILGGGGSDDESVNAAMAARAAASQGGYWRYHGWLFANQAGENDGAFARERLLAMAGAAGLDVEAFTLAMDDPMLRHAVLDETRQGRAQGISSTPTFVIGGQVIVGLRSADELGAVIDAQLP